MSLTAALTALPVQNSPGKFPRVFLQKVSIPRLLVDEVVDFTVNSGKSDSPGGVDLVPREVAQVELQRHG